MEKPANQDPKDLLVKRRGTPSEVRGTARGFGNYYLSPVGLLWIEAQDDGITLISFEERRERSIQSSLLVEKCIDELKEYFSGKRQQFSVPLKLNGTPFQNRVWNQLQTILFGKTITYLQLAKDLGDPKSIRAAGTANGRNPLPIIIPCHRVIGSNGSLVGYGGGLEKKKWLLEFERGSAQGSLFQEKKNAPSTGTGT